MSKDEIINMALMMKNKYGSDAFKIAKNVGIGIDYTNVNPKYYKGYTIRHEKPIIILNNHLTHSSQKIVCAHELGHALLHKDKLYNGFDDSNPTYEYEANLFAVALLFNQEDLNFNISKMDNFMLRNLLDSNIKLKP